MDELKSTIAKNLVELRTQAGFTQLQLAEKLNYSDKAVSKWERGEAIPDIRVLIQLSELYGVSIDDLVKGTDISFDVQPKKHVISKHAFITVLSVILVWFVATGIFALLYFVYATKDYAWLVFVIAPLPTGIVLTVFSALWGNRLTTALASSLIVWSLAVTIQVCVTVFLGFKPIFMLYIVAAVFEILIIVWFVYRWFIKRKR